VRFWLAIALFLILTVTGTAYSRLPGNRESGVFDTDPPTPYFHYRPIGTLRGRVLVIHGLDAAKNVMNILSFGLADAGFEVFSIDLPGHGESRGRFNAVQASSVVGSVLDKLGPQTIVLGHSFGAAVLLELANERPMERMVLFSPAPIVLQTVQSDHLLVIEGQFDPGRIRTFVPQIESAATGTFELRDLAWTGHSGGLFKAGVIASVAEWLGGDATSIHTTTRVVLVGLMLLSSVGLGITLLGRTKAVPPIEETPPVPATMAILYYAIGCLIAAGVLAFVNVAGWLHIFVWDYLLGLFFLAGLLVLTRCKGLTLRSRGLTIGIAAALYVILVVGGFGASEVLHTLPSGERWWRVLGIFVLTLPMFLADEYLLRPLRPAGKAAGAAIVTRVLIGAIVISGALILNRHSAFLLLLTHMAVVFWVGLWFAAGAVRTRTGPFAAACFTAIVQAWFFAAAFVIV